MTKLEELFADIRNKLQPCKTVLESLPPNHLNKIALENLDKIEQALNSHKNVTKGSIWEDQKMLTLDLVKKKN